VLRKLKLQLKKRIEEFNRTSADADTLGFRPIKCPIELNPYSDMLYLQQSVEKFVFGPKLSKISELNALKVTNDFVFEIKQSCRHALKKKSA
jgi:hypothetical protein